MRFKLALFIAIFVAFFLVYINVSALWHSGMFYPDVYGVWAHITTPPTALPIYNFPAGSQSGVYSWVSLPIPNWIQTGWHYYYTSEGVLKGPLQFIETCINGCFGPPLRYIEEFNLQDWGTEVWYLIEFTPGTDDQWCAYINGVQKRCQAIVAPPVTGEVFSEIQINSRNELNTYFNDVYYKGSNFVWEPFDQGGIAPQSEFPYGIEVFQPSNFRTFRLKIVYVPVIMK